jgi:hypothetical protein
MRRLTTTLALGLCLLGCGSGAPVQLLTGPLMCYAGGEQGSAGSLVADPEYGTRFNGKPVMWPEGFTGVRTGGKVEVLGPAGNTVATTGRRYYISFAYVPHELIEKTGAYPAAANCGYPWDFVDCGSPATGPGMDAAERSCGSQ